MENINIPVNYVAIHQGDYRDLIKDSENLYRLKEAAFSGIYWQRYSYDNHLDANLNADPILDALRVLFPEDYKAVLETTREAFLADEAKGEEE